MQQQQQAGRHGMRGGRGDVSHVTIAAGPLVRRRAVRVRRKGRPLGRPVLAAAAAVIALALLSGWEALVRTATINAFLLPAPSQIAAAFAAHAAELSGAAWSTLRVTVEAFVLACAVAAPLAAVASRFAAAERLVMPFAIVLQVTPIVAVAPLVLIWVGQEHLDRALLLVATIVAFFPVLVNAMLGLRRVDPGLRDLMSVCRATPAQRLRLLDLPSSVPDLLAGMKISGGLALVGAVVAETVAGSGQATGLAWLIVEAANNLDLPKMFASLALLSLMGVCDFLLLNYVNWRLLRRWHDSAVDRAA